MKTIQIRLVVMIAFLSFVLLPTSAVFSQAAKAKTAKPTKTTKAAKVLLLNGNDAMQFDKKEFRVKAGEKIKLTLKHTGKFAKQAMGHNFVLLQSGVNIADFASKANLARDNEYIPKSEAAKIIAHTKLLGGGESDTIEFTAPKKGTYPFICSFPGHYGLMQGKFIVE